uniref:Galactosylgalactosylxylosylprotein 3-beta-glucuronosyltransferase n=1 Tax=Rhabditophanes sp. KR3021 TaxID=114890 RepID=A0AC35TXJ5_9BILA
MINVRPRPSNDESAPPENVQIIVITPTYKRYTRIADMTRMANTLSHFPNLHWLVVEDGNVTSKLVESLLQRTALPYTYLLHQTKTGYPKRGWYQRDMALTYLRENYQQISKGYSHSVVYFGDDDNSYDLRLFSDYIVNVKKVGIWAVGLVGGAPFESPKVENNSVVGWHVKWNPKRKFATDMAGFAFSLQSVLDHPKALFGTSCKAGGGAPEPCILDYLGFSQQDLEPFGFDKPPNVPREIYVYHTKTVKPSTFPPYELYGYEIEL